MIKHGDPLLDFAAPRHLGFESMVDNGSHDFASKRSTRWRFYLLHCSCGASSIEYSLPAIGRMRIPPPPPRSRFSQQSNWRQVRFFWLLPFLEKNYATESTVNEAAAGQPRIPAFTCRYMIHTQYLIITEPGRGTIDGDALSGASRRDYSRGLH